MPFKQRNGYLDIFSKSTLVAEIIDSFGLVVFAIDRVVSRTCDTAVFVVVVLVLFGFFNECFGGLRFVVTVKIICSP